MKKDKVLVQTESDKLYQEIIHNGYDEVIAKQISDEMREKGGLECVIIVANRRTIYLTHKQ